MKLYAEDVEKIRFLANTGVKISELARSWNCTPTAISRILKNFNVNIKSRNGSNVAILLLDKIKLKYGDLVHDLIRDFHQHPELTAQDISELAGISRERVRQIICIVHGVSARKKGLYLRRNDCRITSCEIGNKKIRPTIINYDYYEKILSIITANINHNVYPVYNKKYFQTYLVNNKLVGIRTFRQYPSRPNVVILRDFKNNIEYMVGEFDSEVYVIPPNGPFHFTTGIIKSRLEPYKNAWHLL